MVSSGSAMNPQDSIGLAPQTWCRVDRPLPAPARGRTQSGVTAWLRKLDPFRASAEWIFEHCVSPSPAATARQSHATHRKSRELTIHLRGKESLEEHS